MHFQLRYAVDNAPEVWSYSGGFVNEMIRDDLRLPAEPLILTCGCRP